MRRPWRGPRVDTDTPGHFSLRGCVTDSPPHDALDRRVVLREDTSAPIPCDEVVPSQTPQLMSQPEVRHTISILGGVAREDGAAAHDGHGRLTKLGDISSFLRSDRLH